MQKYLPNISSKVSIIIFSLLLFYLTTVTFFIRHRIGASNLQSVKLHSNREWQSTFKKLAWF